MHTCTTEDLLLYLYNDLPADERTNIEVMLQENWGHREKLQVLKEAKEKLNNTPLEAPHTQSLKNVLDHLYAPASDAATEKRTYSTWYSKPAADML